VLHERGGAAIGRELTDDVVAGLDQGEHGCGECGHSGGRHQTRFCAFQVGNDLGHLSVVGVPIARVEALAAELCRGRRELRVAR
jgi:hypothetical protein